MIAAYDLLDLVHVGACKTEQGRQEIDVTGQHLDRLVLREEASIVDDQRHMSHLLVGAVPLLVQTAMGPEQLAVVGEEEHDRIVIEAGTSQLFKYT